MKTIQRDFEMKTKRAVISNSKVCSFHPMKTKKPELDMQCTITDVPIEMLEVNM